MSVPEAPGNGPAWFRASPPVFLGSAALIIAFVLYAAFDSDTAGAAFAVVQQFIIETFGWLYVTAIAVFIFFVIAIALGPVGRIRLGADDEQPDFSYFSWFSMLFSAGMGIGIMFYGVAEPILHFSNPPEGEGGTFAAAREAMEISFFHWGVHAWAIYAVMGLALAYFSFRKGLPLTVRSALYPLIGDRIYGPIGHAVDIFAVLGTMFGVATSLGLGVMQVNAGLSYLFGLPQNLPVQVALIAGITAVATLSVVSGINAGIRRLSELNLVLALTLLLFVAIAGPTAFLITVFVQNLGDYLTDFIPKTFLLYAYRPDEREWLGGWTLFYWGWWISWSPFVGMFIARISRGRTLREFIIGVLMVPSILTFIWMTVFGNTAINLELNDGITAITDAVEADVAVALFQFLQYLPMTAITSGIATLLVITFFVTSSDSGSLVIDIITSGGQEDPPVWQRVFWAVTEGVVAAVLLLAGGLTALQTAAITGALPLTFILLVVCWGIFTSLRKEQIKSDSRRVIDAAVSLHPTASWQQRLKAIMHYPSKSGARRFLDRTVRPALAKVAGEVEEQGVAAHLTEGEEAVELVLGEEGEEEAFLYGVELKPFRKPAFAIDALSPRSKEGDVYYRAEVRLKDGGQAYDIMDYTEEQVIADLLSHYEQHRHVLHVIG